MAHGNKKGAKWRKDKALTPEILERMAEVLLRGNYLETAAHVAGISPKIAREAVWRGRKEFERIEQGLPADPEMKIFLDFYNVVNQSIHIAEDNAVGNLTSAGDKDWRAAAHYLSRRHNKRWGKTLTFQMQDEINGLFDKLQCGLTEREFEKVLSICLEKSGETEATDSEGEET